MTDTDPNPTQLPEDSTKPENPHSDDGDQPSNLSPGRQRLFRVIALLVFSVVTLLILELLLSVTNTEAAIRRGYRRGGMLRPYDRNSQADLVSAEFHVHYAINRFGYRDKDWTLSKRDGVKRVLILGDSFAEGWGVEAEQRFSEILDKQCPKLEFWNLARNGGCPVQYVYQLRTAIPQFKPDFLIVQLFDNDLEDNWTLRNNKRMQLAADSKDGPLGPIHPDFKPDDSLGERLQNWLRKRQLRRLTKRVLRRAEGKTLYRNLFRRPSGSKQNSLSYEKAARKQGKMDFREASYMGFNRPELDGSWPQSLAFGESVMEQLLRLCQKHSLPVALVYIPAPYVFHEPTIAPHNRHQQMLRSLSQKHSVAFVDMGERGQASADPKRWHFPLDGHYNERGHKQLAEALRPIVERWQK